MCIKTKLTILHSFTQDSSDHHVSSRVNLNHHSNRAGTPNRMFKRATNEPQISQLHLTSFRVLYFSPPHVTESKQFFYWLDSRGLGMGLRTLCSIQYLVKIVQLTGIGKAPRTRFNDCRNLKNIYRGGQKSLFYRLGDSSASREVRSRNLHRDKRVLPSLCKCAER